MAKEVFRKDGVRPSMHSTLQYSEAVNNHGELKRGFPSRWWRRNVNVCRYPNLSPKKSTRCVTLL